MVRHRLKAFGSRTRPSLKLTHPCGHSWKRVIRCIGPIRIERLRTVGMSGPGAQPAQAAAGPAELGRQAPSHFASVALDHLMVGPGFWQRENKLKTTGCVQDSSMHLNHGKKSNLSTDKRTSKSEAQLFLDEARADSGIRIHCNFAWDYFSEIAQHATQGFRAEAQAQGGGSIWW